MEPYQAVIAGLIGLLFAIMISEHFRIDKLVWQGMLATGRHIESPLHPTSWRNTDPETWELVTLNDGSRGIIPKIEQTCPWAFHSAEFYVRKWLDDGLRVHSYYSNSQQN